MPGPIPSAQDDSLPIQAAEHVRSCHDRENATNIVEPYRRGLMNAFMNSAPAVFITGIAADVGRYRDVLTPVVFAVSVAAVACWVILTRRSSAAALATCSAVSETNTWPPAARGISDRNAHTSRNAAPIWLDLFAGGATGISAYILVVKIGVLFFSAPIGGLENSARVFNPIEIFWRAPIIAIISVAVAAKARKFGAAMLISGVLSAVIHAIYIFNTMGFDS